MDDIKVSIITVCYNSEATIEKTILSVLEQTYENIEYIIVDGASKDGTMSIINRYTEQFGDRLRVISEPDDGIYYAMNKGIRVATGDLIGIINSDDWYEKDAVKIVVDSFKKKCDNPLAVYYGKTGIYRDGVLIRVASSSHEKLEEDMISHPSCFVTDRVYEDIGLFNTNYCSVADYDLMLRCKRSKKVDFVFVDAHIANFALGGMSSTGKAYIDLVRLKMDYGQISVFAGQIDIMKAKLAIMMEKRGLKPVSIGKKK